MMGEQKQVHLKRWRLAKGLTQYELSMASGVQIMTISRIETGVVVKPLRLTMRALARALKVKVEQLHSDPDQTKKG